MTHQEMWAAYRAASPDAGEEYEAWAYGDDPDGLALTKFKYHRAYLSSVGSAGGQTISNSSHTTGGI